MAKWLSEESPRYQYDLNARRKRANEIISMVQRVSVDYDALKADYERVSPLRSLLQHAKETKRRKPRLTGSLQRNLITFR